MKLSWSLFELETELEFYLRRIGFLAWFEYALSLILRLNTILILFEFEVKLELTLR